MLSPKATGSHWHWRAAALAVQVDNPDIRHLRSIYDDVTPEDMRRVASQVRAATDTSKGHQVETSG